MLAHSQFAFRRRKSYICPIAPGDGGATAYLHYFVLDFPKNRAAGAEVGGFQMITVVRRIIGVP